MIVVIILVLKFLFQLFFVILVGTDISADLLYAKEILMSWITYTEKLWRINVNNAKTIVNTASEFTIDRQREAFIVLY